MLQPSGAGSRGKPSAAGGLARGARVLFHLARFVNAASRARRHVGHRLRGGRGAPPVRILVARRVRLGDLVVALPLLDALREADPQARVELAVTAPEPARTLALEAGRVHALQVLDDDAPLRRRLLARLRLAACGHDVLITGERFALMREAFFCGAPRRVGFDDGHPLRADCSHLVPFDRARHAADNLRALGVASGCAVAGRPRAPALAPSPPLQQKAVRHRLGLADGGPLIVLHPGAQKPSRRWPEARFAALAAALLATSPARGVVLTGTPSERPLIDRLRQGVPEPHRTRLVSAAGRTGVGELLALLSGASLVIANDTGVLHVARALGRPVLGLMSGGEPLLWGPYPGAQRAPQLALRHDVPCAPCPRMACPLLYCLRTLEVEEAHKAAEALLGEGERASSLAAPPCRHDWRALARAGYALPTVALVRMRGGAGAPSGRKARSDGSLYPELELLDGSGASDVVALLGGALRRSAARFVGVCRGSEPPDLRLADAVARLVAEPRQVAVDARGRPVAANAPLRAGVLYRRRYLEARTAPGTTSGAARSPA